MDSLLHHIYRMYMRCLCSVLLICFCILGTSHAQDRADQWEGRWVRAMAKEQPRSLFFETP